MADNFKVVDRIPVCLEEGTKYQAELVGNEVVISKEVKTREWVNITTTCGLEFKFSQHNSGKYIAIIPYGSSRPAAVVGTKGIIAQKGFKVEPAPGASISFEIFEKCRR